MPDELEIELSSLSPEQRYELLNSVVVPRPIAWICTVDASGRANLAPFSYFNLCSLTPPIVHFTATSSIDSIANVRATSEFVLNTVSEELAHAIHRSSGAPSHSQGDVDEGAEWGARGTPEEGGREEMAELMRAGLSALPSAMVRPPRLAEAKVSLECTLLKILEIGEGTMVFGEVLCAHVKGVTWHGGEVQAASLRPLARMGGSNYATISEVKPLSAL